MSGARVAAATNAAHALLAQGGAASTKAAQPRPPPSPLPGARPRVLAMGDPQAKLERVLEVLDAHGALGDDGWLADELTLISMGDHFDWGGNSASERDQAAADGEALLRWLAAHPRDQVVILAGNHDLARVGELWGLSDAEFRKEQEAADGAYQKGEAVEAAFRAAHTRWPCPEVVARDLSTYRERQRHLVTELLQAERMVAAHAFGGALYVHAGVTTNELRVLALDGNAPPEFIATKLNSCLRAAAADLDSRPLVLEGLHVPGNASAEGSGMFYHRPTRLPAKLPVPVEGEARTWRRFNPEHLPQGLVQVVGHVGDKKCREELGDWCAPANARYGVVRHLVVSAGAGRYAHGPPPVDATNTDALMIFIDNGMKDVAAASDYQLLDAKSRRPAPQVR